MTESPRISVIIPTYNRAPAVRLCLEALANQTAGAHGFEVIVVDDGSTDDTEAAATAQPGLNLRYVRQENAGANAARNRGIEAAAAPLLMFINDDTIAAPDLIETHCAAHDAFPEETCAILGRMTIHPDFADNPFSPLHHDASYLPLEHREEVDWTCFFTCNVSLKTDFLKRVGEFEEGLRWHEDIELGERLARNGMRLLYRPDALGYHWHGLDERQYLRIADREGEALALWWNIRPDLTETLVRLGLVGAPSLERPVRYRVADAAFSVVGQGLPLWAARTVASVSPETARVLWRKVFQHRKRQAITAALRNFDTQRETAT